MVGDPLAPAGLPGGPAHQDPLVLHEVEREAEVIALVLRAAPGVVGTTLEGVTSFKREIF